MRNIERELKDNRLWRAKEILQSQLRDQGRFDPDVLRQYGELLLRMGDTLEAGRYLFFSGVRRPEYEAAIHLFVVRHAKNKNVTALAPKVMRRIENLKDIVGADRFRSEGFSFALIEAAKTDVNGAKTVPIWAAIAGYGAFAFIVLMLLVGLASTFEFLTDRASSLIYGSAERPKPVACPQQTVVPERMACLPVDKQKASDQ